jgi:membrane-bound serine protease (ClpP class)
MGLVLLAQALGVTGVEAAPAAAPGMVVLLDLDGAIGPASADHVRRGLALAASEHAELVVLRIDTPGGLDASARDITQAILASPVPVAAFVSPEDARVAGAGAGIVHASHITAVTLGAVLGAPAPAPALGKKAVTLVAQDVSDLLRQLNGHELTVGKSTVRLATQGVQVLMYEEDWRTHLLELVTTPSVALILLMVGVYGVLFAIFNPGFAVPGVIGGACLTLALFGMKLLPVNYAALALVLLGAGLLVAAAFVRRMSWLIVLLGVAAFATGAMLLIENDASGFGVPLWLVAVLSVVSVFFSLVPARREAKARRREAPSGGVSTLIGLTGELVEYADGEGWAQIEGDYWRVHGDRDLSAGRRIRVTRVKDLGLQVAADGKEPGAGW